MTGADPADGGRGRYWRRPAAACCLAACAWALAAGTAQAVDLNGFDLSAPLVPREAIHHGGPPRDGIPAIDRPQFVPGARADFIAPDERVLGVLRNGVAKAYPIAILNWHEVVNDRFGSEPVVVTFCPLCGTGTAHSARVDGKSLRFGVSGLLYNSDVLLYDRATESLWSQLLGRAVSGPLKGTRLERVALAHTSWADWRARHPDTSVLSRDTGHRRDYGRDPYADYAVSPGVWFTVAHRNGALHPKAWVLGVEIGEAAKAYPFDALARAGGVVRDRVGGESITIRYRPAARSAAAFDADGREIPAVSAFWFAWFAFHPETAVYAADE